MAPLNPVHWETVTPGLRELMTDLGNEAWMSDFYLAGGTALALQIGHRRSIDLDFFSSTNPIHRECRDRILDTLKQRSPAVIEDVDGNLLVRVGSQLHVAFLSYGYRLIDALGSVENVAIASVPDIGLMKLDAAISRGSRKDFIDLYFIARDRPLDDLLHLAEKKYPYARDFPLMAIESLIRFDNADGDRQPEMLIECPWDEVRAFFIAEAKRLGRAWLRL